MSFTCTEEGRFAYGYRERQAGDYSAAPYKVIQLNAGLAEHPRQREQCCSPAAEATTAPRFSAAARRCHHPGRRPQPVYATGTGPVIPEARGAGKHRRLLRERSTRPAR
jgi:hypothetical protein